MRQSASNSFEARIRTGLSEIPAGEVKQHVEEWLASKGTQSKNGQKIEYGDGRLAAVVRREITSTSGRIFEATLTEPTAGAAESGMFRTAFAPLDVQMT